MEKKRKVIVGLCCVTIAVVCIAVSCNTGVYISIGEREKSMRLEVDSARNIKIELLTDSIKRYEN